MGRRRPRRAHVQDLRQHSAEVARPGDLDLCREVRPHAARRPHGRSVGEVGEGGGEAGRGGEQPVKVRGEASAGDRGGAAEGDRSPQLQAVGGHHPLHRAARERRRGDRPERQPSALRHGEEQGQDHQDLRWDAALAAVRGARREYRHGSERYPRMVE